jgi:hypothetical protein
MSPVPLNTSDYTVAAEQLTNGDIDTWSSYGLYISNHTDIAHYTTPFGVEKYAVLMRRHDVDISINFIGLMADIDYRVYLIYFTSVLVLIAVAHVHEAHTTDRCNSLWTICRTVMPCNTAPLQYCVGVTRKVLAVTCAIAVLLPCIFYQTNLLQQLMIPKQLPQISIQQVANNIATRKSNVYMIDTLSVLIDESNSVELKNALAQHPPTLGTVHLSRTEDILTRNAIIIEDVPSVHQRLSHLKSSECANYDVVELPEIVPSWVSLLIRKGRRDALEALNVVVAERMNFVYDLIDANALSNECRKHIYPSNSIEQKFTPLSIYTLSGTFFLIACLCFLSFIMLLCEIIVHKSKYTKPLETLPQKRFLLLNCDIDTIKLSHRDEIIRQYNILCDLIALHVQ